MILVTGGAGFIGSNFVLDWLAHQREPVVNLDKLTYAGNVRNLAPVAGDARHRFVRGDIGDAGAVGALLARHRPRAIVNFAAETHVDRSTFGPAAFIDTNVVGTFALLECVPRMVEALPEDERSAFRFLHVSTDECTARAGPDDPPFSETTPFAPNSPYAASKASSDHVVRVSPHVRAAYADDELLEQLRPAAVSGEAHSADDRQRARGRLLPVYGDGRNVGDWLYVGDHCSAIRTVLDGGRPGETYNVGGGAEMANIDVVHTLCGLVDERKPGSDCRRLVTYVTDRPDTTAAQRSTRRR
jgi:dTDP-glucose 4,6-dehydratase